MKKIAIFSGTLSRGGAERVTVYLAEFFRRQGADVVIITLRKGEKEYSVPNGVKRYIVDDICKNRITGIRKILIEESVDIYLVMGVSNTTYGILPSYGLKTRIIISERNSPQNFNGKNITRIISRKLMRHADGFVFQTEDAKKFYSKILKNRGVVIPNPLMADNIPLAYQGERKKKIVAVGRLVEQKNHKVLIEAFSDICNLYPEYIVEIYGEGNLRDELTELISNLHLTSRVFLKGNVNDIYSHIIDASIFVMPSNFEGMPNALIEAMAIGLPCISTDCPCGGPRELISDNYNGLLVPVGDRKKLAGAMNSLISDKNLRDKIGINAVTVKEKLDANSIGKKWMDYFSSF